MGGGREKVRGRAASTQYLYECETPVQRQGIHSFGRMQYNILNVQKVIKLSAENLHKKIPKRTVQTVAPCVVRGTLS